MYSREPEDKRKYTQNNNKLYSRFAKVYDIVVKGLPIWRNWISAAIPQIVGPDVLEVSFGTGYLIAKYARQFTTYGIDYNWELAHIAQQNLHNQNVQASIQLADVEYLPYHKDSFDTVVNTMAFTGYPNGTAALLEIMRVLKPTGRFVLIDIDYPKDQNWLGTLATRAWSGFGDIIRDMEVLFQQNELEYTKEEVGGFGSVHLFVATKK